MLDDSSFQEISIQDQFKAARDFMVDKRDRKNAILFCATPFVVNTSEGFPANLIFAIAMIRFIAEKAGQDVPEDVSQGLSIAEQVDFNFWLAGNDIDVPPPSSEDLSVAMTVYYENILEK